jgi:hypothetical protein
MLTLAAGVPLPASCIAPASGMPTTTSISATASPISPATTSAETPPMPATKAAMIAGATALPRKPAKLWIENARPIRFSSMCAERIA